MSAEVPKLKQQIGLVTATSVVVGIMIGSGVFVKPGKVLLQTGSSTSALLAWLAGGLMTIFAGLTIAEVAARIPKTGGVYAYVNELFGDKMGFLCGWVLTFLYSPGLKGALSLYFAALAQPILGFETKIIPQFAIGSLLFLAILNMVSTKASGAFQTLTTVAKLIPIVVICLLGIATGTQHPFGSIPVPVETLSFGAAVLSTLWAYDGWMLVGNVAGEMKNPVRDVPRAIFIGLFVVLIAYLGVNLALFKILPLGKIAELGPNAANAAAEILLGEGGGKLISIGILISIYGCLNGDVLSGPRVPFAMAARGNLKRVSLFGKASKYGTPVNAIILQVFVAIIMILAAKPDTITDFALFSVYIFYTLAMVGVFILRKKQPETYGRDSGGVKKVSAKGKYQTPFFPVVPILAILSSLYILGNTLFEQTSMAAISIGLTLTGVPAYYLLRKK